MTIFYIILSAIGAIGVFLFGMKIMSEALQKVAGIRLRNILSAITSNRLKSILTGLLTTASVQSSSAITVMLVSFASAGLISVFESAGVVMGANIGTTITAWIISLLGFGKHFSIQIYLLPLIGLSLPLFFSKSSNLRSWGEFIIGFSLLFFGLGFLKEVIPLVPEESGLIRNLTSYYSGNGFVSLIVFFVLGLLLTIIFQSSSATMALTFVLAIEGWVPFSLAAAMVLGENLGTTFTALIASTIANKDGRRVAVIHLMFNLAGIIWGLILLKPILNLIDIFMTGISMASPNTDPGNIPVALSIFHTGFNILNMIILVGFIPKLVDLTAKVFPTGQETDEKYRLRYIDTRFLSTSEISIVQARKEIAVMGKRTLEMFDMIPVLLIEKRQKDYKMLMERIEKYESIIDNMEVEIAMYLTKASEGKLSDQSSAYIKSMMRIIDDLESIGDVSYKLSRLIDSKNQKNLYFIQELRDNCNALFKLTRASLENMIVQLSRHYTESDMAEISEIDNAIHQLREKLRQEHVSSIKKEKYSYQTGIIYNDIVRLTERVGDYAFRVSESVNEVKESKN